jgi:hypothetical protein
MKAKFGYFPVFVYGSRLGYGHHLGGTNSIRNAKSPYTNLPLTLFMQLDLADPKLRDVSGDIPSIPLLGSWTCAVQVGAFCYHVNSKGIEIIQYKKHPNHEICLRPAFPSIFPKRNFMLREVFADEAKIIRGVNREVPVDIAISDQARPDLHRPCHQILGEPFLLFPKLPSPVCVNCLGSMFFLASVSNESMSEIPFVDNDYSQILFHFCGKCCVITTQCYAD